MNDIITQSSLELSEKIRSKKLSPVEVMESFLDRIETVNPHTNAIVVERFEEALQEAREAESALNDKDPENLPPLHGVPFSIKEMFSFEGYPITCGSVKREDVIATGTAPVVELLLEAGAIPVGFTNVPELGLWFESSNYVYGQTNNPHDLSRTAGGSSGGEAANIASAGTPFGIGSDMGGSIRLPAMFCGVYGHKPTTDDVTVEGHFPLDYSPIEPDHTPSAQYVSVGPIARHAEDLAPLLEIMRGNNRFDEILTNLKKSSENFQDSTVYVMDDPDIWLVSNINNSQRNVIHQAADVLADRGANIETWDHGLLKRATDIFMSCLEDEDHPPATHLAGTDEPINVISEVMNLLGFRSNHTLPMIMLSLLESVYTPPEGRVEHFLEKRDQLADDLEDTLADNNVLVTSPYPRTAPKHGDTIYRPFDAAYASIFNVLDFPVTSAPLGFDDRGLPFGVQIVAPKGRDDLSIAAAMAIEDEFGPRPVPNLTT